MEHLCVVIVLSGETLAVSATFAFGQEFLRDFVVLQFEN